MRTRLLSLIMAAVLAAAIIVFPATAADAAGTLTVETQDGVQGQTVTLAVDLSNNPGFCAARLKVNYDSTDLELTGIELGDKFDSGTDITSSSEIAFYYAWNKYTNGTLLELTFKVQSTAAVGLSEVDLSYNTGDVCNRNEEDVTFNIVAGGVNITGSTGDATYTITPKGWSLCLNDYTYINQYAAIDYTNTTRNYITRNGGLLIFEGTVTAENATYSKASADDTAVIRKGLIYKNTDDGDRFLQQSMGIVPKDYDKIYTFRMYVKQEDGTYSYSDPVTYSVNSYCSSVINDTPTENATAEEAALSQVCQDMITLGSSAKAYFALNPAQ